ncbi:transcription factor Tfb4 [Hypoxylon fragiforme]|uniref:transcription factor Tfb4 n=1 Tax=Hypoxylon fragiforme TaxID=63214 RepID=UPI0020C6D3D5|nr:transcription factor Tfb4 [Hypoxylon fragiforme]KAI2610698.1 transcription factor Tfb4 [Hypoxylon fragiforme]
MNRIDASKHYSEPASTAAQIPSLLTIVIDTNPRAWAALAPLLPISKALANLLVFVNAHLAFGNDSHVAIVAAHPNRAVWLYPKSPNPDRKHGGKRSGHHGNDQDVEMTDADAAVPNAKTMSANKFPQFSEVESSILTSLRSLIEDTTPSDLNPTTLIAGALTLALSYINKMSHTFEPGKTSSSDQASSSNTAAAGGVGSTNQSSTGAVPTATLHSRILVLSVSDSEPAQYIPTMNAVFAASHARIPLDTLSLYGAPSFLQQAAFITSGTFLSAATNPRGLLTYLMFGFLSDASARVSLVTPTQDTVDFRAACFCHRRVVDTGFVCSICLSIFCEVPPDAECLTCGTKLALGNYGAKPAVVPRLKRKKKKNNNTNNAGSRSAATAAAAGLNGVRSREETGSATGTPVPT